MPVYYLVVALGAIWALTRRENRASDDVPNGAPPPGEASGNEEGDAPNKEGSK